MKRLPQIEIKCLNCSSLFKVKQYRKDTAKYCSRRCLALHCRVELTSNCLICDKSFTHISSRANKAKYCSRSCYYKSQSIKAETKNSPFKIEVSCHHCEKKFYSYSYHSRKYCSRACVSKENKKTFSPKFTTVRRQMQRRSMIQKCNRCGFDSHPNILGVHHRDHDRNNNDISNLEVLCANCHSIEHNKHICH